jgi:hypothetical protein
MLDEQVSGQHAHTPAASISAHVVRLLLSYDSDDSCSQSIMSGWRTPWLTAEGFEMQGHTPHAAMYSACTPEHLE